MKQKIIPEIQNLSKDSSGSPVIKEFCSRVSKDSAHVSIGSPASIKIPVTNSPNSEPALFAQRTRLDALSVRDQVLESQIGKTNLDSSGRYLRDSEFWFEKQASCLFSRSASGMMTGGNNRK